MSNRAPQVQLPAWPALLTTDLACAFLSLSEASFRLLTGTHQVRPMECAGLAVTRWRRTDLEALVANLTERGAIIGPEAGPEAPDPAPPVDLAQEALRRASRRVRGAA